MRCGANSGKIKAEQCLVAHNRASQEVMNSRKLSNEKLKAMITKINMFIKQGQRSR